MEAPAIREKPQSTLKQKQGSESSFHQVVGFDDGLFRPADLLWPEFPSQLSFDRKTEAVGAVDALMLKDD